MRVTRHLGTVVSPANLVTLARLVFAPVLFGMVLSAEHSGGTSWRGFLLGGAVALELGVGVLAVRKGGKLPPPVLSETYTLEYGTATLEVPAEGVDLAGRSVVVIDDVLATGGTAAATAKLVESCGAEIVEIAFLMELGFLEGRAKLGGRPIYSLLTY